jgi:branched-chain amino acid aminotransferase
MTDHMAISTFHPETGWSAPEIKPYASLTLDPASSCFQYSPSVFEGMKVCWTTNTNASGY